jgi:zinc transporter, ZIP family
MSILLAFPSDYYKAIVDSFLVIDSRHTTAFLLSFWASMGTFLGGIIVILVIKFFNANAKSQQTLRLMGAMQAFSAGVMLYITCFHLVPESVEAIGDTTTMAFFFVGCLPLTQE